MVTVSQKMKDDYEEFLVEIDLLLEDLQTLLSQSRNYKDVTVGYDSDTLDRIELFYLDALSGKERVAVSLERLGRILIAFFGESLIQRVRGEWALNEMKDDPAFGTPVIVNWAQGGGGVRFSPVERREWLKKSSEPSMRELIEYAENKEKIEEDFFKQFKKKRGGDNV